MNLELFLNLLWLGLAVSGFAALVQQAASGRRGIGQAALTILCALAILFPIVSVTDDLHADLQAVEEWGASRRAQCTPLLHHFDSPHGSAGLIWIALAVMVGLAALLLATESAEAAVVPRLRASLVVPARSHAPPLRG